MFVLPLTRAAVPTSYRTALLPRSRNAIDRLFDESLDRVYGASPASRTPAMDVTETDAAFTVTLEVPGVSREQLKVSVQGRRVSIETLDVAKNPGADTAEAAEKTEAGKSEASVAESKDEVRVLYRERVAAKFARTVSLPAEVDQASSQARFDNGVLTLTLAKKVPTGATQLRIG